MHEKILARRDRVRRVLTKQNLAALLVTNPVNVRYLTGFTGGDSYLLFSPDGETLLSDPRFTIQIEEECPGLDVAIRPGGVSLVQAVAKILGKNSSGTLGLEAESVTLAEQERISQALPRRQLVPTRNIVEEFRQVKDRSEVDLIRKAIDVAHRAFQDLRENIKPEQSEVDLRNDLEYLMRLFGGEEKSFPSIIGAGPRAALPHGTPSDMKVEGQSHVLFDWGAIVDGYMSDLTRVLIFAPNNKRLRTIYDTVLKAQEAAIAAIKPGKTGEEIDAVARAIIRDEGFGRYFNHGLGHGLGLEIHENPRFAIGNKTILKPGMVLTVEPGIYLKNWGGVRVEDDILVTRTGCEVLSQRVPKAFEDMVV